MFKIILCSLVFLSITVLANPFSHTFADVTGKSDLGDDNLWNTDDDALLAQTFPTDASQNSNSGSGSTEPQTIASLNPQDETSDADSDPLMNCISGRDNLANNPNKACPASATTDRPTMFYPSPDTRSSNDDDEDPCSHESFTAVMMTKHVSCGGPTVSEYRTFTPHVFNCVEGAGDHIRKRTFFKEVRSLAQFCCEQFDDNPFYYLASMCVIVKSPKKRLHDWAQYQYRYWEEHIYKGTIEQNYAYFDKYG